MAIVSGLVSTFQAGLVELLPIFQKELFSKIPVDLTIFTVSVAAVRVPYRLG